MNGLCGQQIAGYRVVRLLGRGGMAEVYEVERLGMRRAMKVFVNDGEQAELLKSRFLAEGRLLARLDHPRLVKVHDCGVDEATGRPYLAMDLVVGADGEPHTLASLHTAHHITEDKLLGWYADLASALAYIHAAGVVHRDVKPSNILVAADGHAVLADFGVSRVSDRALRTELSIDATMATDATTLSRIVFGTANYLAPEVRRGDAATAAADLYSLGVTFFRLLTGVWYEPDTNALELLKSFDPVWRRIFPALLAADPRRRSLPPCRRTRKRLAWVLVTCAAAVLAVALAWRFLHEGRDAPPAGGSGVSPLQGHDAPPAGGSGVSPLQGRDAPPAGGSGVSPLQGHDAPPAGGSGDSPLQGHDKRDPNELFFVVE